jgi:hypothetical protein
MQQCSRWQRREGCNVDRDDNNCSTPDQPAQAEPLRDIASGVLARTAIDVPEAKAQQDYRRGDDIGLDEGQTR